MKNRQILWASAGGLAAVALFLIIWVVTSPLQKTSAQTFNTVDSQLGLGSSGSEVTTLQNFLASNRVVYPEGLVTGYYGPLTEKAVRNLQIGYGLPAVGRVGPMTMAKINSLIIAGDSIDVSGPEITSVDSSVSGNDVTITVKTNEDARAKVYFSKGSVRASETLVAKVDPTVTGEVEMDNDFSRSHEIKLSDLDGRSSYNFIVLVSDKQGNVSVTRVMDFETR